MSRLQKDPLRPLSGEERAELERVSRGQMARSALPAMVPAASVARAKAVLSVAEGQSFTAAARLAGRRHGDTVAQWVTGFNRAGLAALEPQHGGGQPKRYGVAEQERILQEARRDPDRETDGTATWSLATLQRSLRQAPDGLPAVSTFTLWSVLHEGGLHWGKDRSWCETGTAVRKRKSGTVAVTDPDAVPKKT